MAINEFLTAAALPAGSPLGALFPIVAANDLYRELFFPGGIVGGKFDVGSGAVVIPSAPP